MYEEYEIWFYKYKSESKSWFSESDLKQLLFRWWIQFFKRAASRGMFKFEPEQFYSEVKWQIKIQ